MTSNTQEFEILGPHPQDTPIKNQSAFHWLLGGCACANLSDGISLAFFPLIAVAMTSSASQISMLDGLRQLPLLFLALPAGILADRFNRIWSLIILNGLRGLTLLWLSMALFQGNLTLLGLGAVALILGAIEAIHDVALPTVLPDIESNENLTKCNGILSSTETTANYFLGRSLGSLVAALISNGFAVVISALLYFATAILMIPLISKSKWRTKNLNNLGIFKTIAEGFSYVYEDKKLRYLAIMGVLGNTAFGAILATLVLYATKVTSVPTWAFGPIQASFAIGSIIFGLRTSKIIKKFGNWKTLLICVSAIPISFLITPTFPFWGTLVVTSFVNGASAVLWNTVSISYRQQTTPEHLLGRATAVFRLISWGAMPFGSFIGGPMVEKFGYSAPYYFGALLAAMNIPFAIKLWQSSHKVEVK
jgi:MFS family permease